MSESTWAPEPPADSVGDIQKNVAGYVLMPTDDEVLDCALQGIKRAIDRLNTRTWNWALTYYTFSFTAGTQEYTVATNVKQPRNLSLRDSNSIDVDRLSYLPWGTFLKEVQWDNSLTGTPCYYSIPNVRFFGTLRLDIAPNASWVAQYPTARLWYYGRVDYPGSTGFGPNVPPEVVEYITSFAEGHTADRYAPDKAQGAYNRAKELFNPGPGPAGALVRDDCHNLQTDWE